MVEATFVFYLPDPSGSRVFNVPKSREWIMDNLEQLNEHVLTDILTVLTNLENQIGDAYQAVQTALDERRENHAQP